MKRNRLSSRIMIVCGFIGLSTFVLFYVGVAYSRPVQATHSQDNGTNVELVGQIGGSTYAVATAGSYAYIGVGRRLVILRARNY